MSIENIRAQRAGPPNGPSFFDIQSYLDRSSICDLVLSGGRIPFRIQLGIAECFSGLYGVVSETLLLGEEAPFMSHDKSEFFLKRDRDIIYFYLERLDPDACIGESSIISFLDDIQTCLKALIRGVHNQSGILENFVWENPGTIFYLLARRIAIDS